MAEILATMVVKPLVSMVTKKASSHLLDQYQVMKGMEKQHEDLKRKLPAILDTITDAEEKAADKREGAKAWLEKVRKVAYQANDVLDEFRYEALRRKAEEEGHYKKLGMDVIKLFSSHSCIVFRYKMASKLRMILQEIDVLIAEKNEFKFISKSGPPEPISYLRENSSDIIDPTHIASKSRAREKEGVVHRLLAQANSLDLKVLPIVGMGGLGKTTLAQLVYNDPEIQKYFELQLWVCVSDDFDVDSLANKIVKENACEASGSSALGRLQNAVSGKRYLLVLDDVWNRDEHRWDRLKYYLQHGGSGSSVLTTTRDEAVAKLMMGTTEGAYTLESLGADFIEEIIKARAFRSKKEEEWPGELVGMVGEVAKRCAGSPLAAKALGSLLHTKTTEEEWKAVLSRSCICDEENNILPVLKLSYNGLPSHMRQCFAFCAMFPKDYVIDVEMLIQLWMANGFIPEKQGERPETIGKNVFIELASRSFFQDVKGIPFQFNNTEDSGVTCKIHDLMHDVAVDSMGDECATITKKISKSEDFPYSARHLFVSADEAETLLNAYLQKGTPAFQTLICDEYVKEDLKIFSKYNSIRALKINCDSILRPKYLHHLRYLDLSRSDIKTLTEDISMLYHLQTLNLSYCRHLERLPKELKYLTALRHLYTHGCGKLESIPAEFGHLTSLQTLTYFVAGTDSSCCNVGELQNLDLGGRLELSQLENVKGADAQAAGLGNKKKLTELELIWTDTDQEAQNNKHEEVMEGLKPHHGLKILRIYHCGSRTFPTWMNTLRGMVELELCNCNKLKKLPALWELPALEILRLRGLENLHYLCSGGKTPVTFPKLKVLFLFAIPEFEGWFSTDEVQGEGPIFPKVEELSIHRCGSLTALPEAVSVVTESLRGVDTKCRSAFPALRKMELFNLTMFERWEAVEGTLEEEVAFPRLEELSIVSCGSLSALPKGSLLAKQPFGGAETLSGRVDTKCRSGFPALRKMLLHELNMFERWEAVEGIVGEEVTFPRLEELSIRSCGSLSALPKGSLLAKQSLAGAETVGCCSAFPALRKLELHGLSALERWGAVKATGEEVTFPLLENLTINYCPKLFDLPEAPKLSGIVIKGDDQQIFLQAASRYIPSLLNLTLDASPRGRLEEPRAMQKCSRKTTLPAIWLTGCKLLFSSHSSALVLWTCFAQLVDLDIRDSDALDFWPENVFQVLVCLRNLSIWRCSRLTGRTKTSDEQSSPVRERGGLLPCLEFLEIEDCASLVEVPNLPASLKTLHIASCSDNIKSIVFTQQEDTRLASTAVLKLSSAANHPLLPFPCLESLNIQWCRGLSKVANLPPFIKTLYISGCDNLQSLSGQLYAVQKLTIDLCSRLKSLESCLGELRLLKELELSYCRNLVSLPDRPQAYSSLRVLRIRFCDGMKLLPSSLQSRFDYLEEKDLDACYEEPKTQKCAIRSLVCLK